MLLLQININLQKLLYRKNENRRETHRRKTAQKNTSQRNYEKIANNE